MSTISALALALALAADPTPPAPTPPAPAPAAPVQKKDNYLRLAAPAFSGVNVDEKVASFFSEHFAGALVRRGVLVLTPSEINAMIGLERSKQLAGCAEDASSCVAELSNALGVDGLVVGTVAKFGSTLQTNIKVFASNSGTSIKAMSVKATGEEAFLEALAKEAAAVAPDLLQRMGRAAAPTLEVDAKIARMNVVTLGVIGAGVSFFLRRNGQWYSVEYERVLNSWLGIWAEPTIMYLNLDPNSVVPVETPSQIFRGLYKINLLRLDFGARLYWPGKAPSGWWVSPQVGLGSGVVGTVTKDTNDQVTPIEEAGLDLSLGLMFGYRWYPYEYLPVLVGLGGEYHFNQNLLGLPLGRLHVGFAW